MAVKYTPKQDRPLDTVTEQTGVSYNNQSDQEKILLPGERIVADLGSVNGKRFQLTHTRVVLFRSGEKSEHGTVYASARLTDISSVIISRRPRARRSAAWGIVGLFSAIGVWQVTPNSDVGIVAAIAVAIISLLLMADYWIRPSGIHLELRSVGGTVTDEVKGNIADAMEFAKKVEDYRRRYPVQRTSNPFRNYPST